MLSHQPKYAITEYIKVPCIYRAYSCGPLWFNTIVKIVFAQIYPQCYLLNGVRSHTRNTVKYHEAHDSFSVLTLLFTTLKFKIISKLQAQSNLKLLL